MDRADPAQAPVAPRRSPWLALGAVTLALNLFLLGGALGLFLGSRAERPPDPQQRAALELLARQRLVIDQQQRMLEAGQARELQAIELLRGAQRRIERLEQRIEALQKK